MSIIYEGDGIVLTDKDLDKVYADMERIDEIEAASLTDIDVSIEAILTNKD